MARTRYIHRTIVATEAEVMTVNPSTKEFGSVLISVQGNYTDKEDKDLVKAVKKGYDALNLEGQKMVEITDIHTATKSYRMLESLFMSLAEVENAEGGENEDEEEE